MHPCRFVSVLFVLCCVGLAWARAQCDPQWLATNPDPLLRGPGSCSLSWDPDGAGPALPLLVVGGAALSGGRARGVNLAVFDGANWLPLGSGPGGGSGTVLALCEWNGMLVAGGNFPGRVLAWDGTAWLPLGSGPGIPGTVRALTTWNGNLAVGCSSVSGSPLLHTWNGTTWTPLPDPPTLTVMRALVSYQGTLCVGGSAGGLTNGVLERWNGVAWSPSILASPWAGIGEIAVLAVRRSLAIGGADTLYVGGQFTALGGVPVNSLARSSAGGFAWSAVGANPNLDCNALHVRPVGLNGTLVTAAFVSNAGVYQFNSSTATWTPLFGGNVSSLTLHGSSYYATPTVQGGASCQSYGANGWSPVVGHAVVGEVKAVAATPAGFVLGGSFQSTSSLPLADIARWNGTTFEPLGTGMTGLSVDALLVRSDGDLVAGGMFSAAGGVAASNIARWNGTTWSPLGIGTNQRVFALCQLPNGDLIAGGDFALAGGVVCGRVARWNGSVWSTMNFGFNGTVRALAVRGDGTLFAGGSFTNSGLTQLSRIARWNGVAWQPLGSGLDGDVWALACRPNGDLVAVGSFTHAGGLAVDRCAVWNGAAWLSTGSASFDPTPARSVLVLPNGDVVAGRGFHNSPAIIDGGLSRWNGTTWSAIGNGVSSLTSGTVGNVLAMAVAADGSLMLGGDFVVDVQGMLTNGLTVLAPTCPAAAAVVGAGCSSPAGLLSLTADTLPWAGSTLRTTTAGVPATALCLGVVGFTPLSIPLPALLPEGQAGCSLLASLDVVSFVPNGPGDTAQSGFALPNSASLVGVSFLQQSVPLEFGVGGALAAVRSSNALTLTIGVL